MGADSFGYDNRSRLTSSTVSGSPLSYSYDAFGNLNPLAVNAATNRLTSGLYDTRGNLVAIGSQAFAYDSFSRQVAASGGGSPATGSPERYLYDGAGERIARVNGGGQLYTITPCRVLDTRSTPPAIPGGGSRTVQVTGTCGVPAGAVAIAGNLTVVGPSGGGFLVLSAAETSPLTSTIDYAPGMTIANNFQVALSPAGQVRIADGGASTDAILDVTGYFISPSAVENWNLTFRDEANRLSSEYTVGTSVTRTKDYFYFGNLLVSTRDAAGNYSYYSSDHLGTPRLVSGALSETHKYQPFGQEITSSFGNQPLKLATMERDVSSGLDYDHARYTSPTQGRFLSPDLIGGRLSDPQSWNRFTYATNNPVIALDPDGLETTVYVVGIGRSLFELGGHAMLAVQSAKGAGYLSQTTKPPAFRQGSPDPEIGHYLDEGRRVTSIHLNTSPSFDQALYDYISTAAFGSYNLITRNCAQSICRSLGNVGFELARPEAILSPLELGLALRTTPYVVTVTTFYSSFDFYGHYRTSVSVTDYTKTRLTLDLPNFDTRRWLFSLNDLIHQRSVLVEGISLAR